MSKKENLPLEMCTDTLSSGHQCRLNNPLEAIIEQSNHVAFNGHLGTFIRSIVVLHSYEKPELISDKARLVLYRLCHMMEAYVMCFENQGNGLFRNIELEFEQELLLGANEYLPEDPVKKGYRMFFEAAGMEESVRVLEGFMADIDSLRIKANEGWGIRLLTDIYLWYGICSPSVKEIADQIFRVRTWTAKDYTQANTPLNALRKMVKSCHLSHDDYTPIHYNDIIRMICWFNSVMGDMGQRVQLGLLS